MCRVAKCLDKLVGDLGIQVLTDISHFNFLCVLGELIVPLLEDLRLGSEAWDHFSHLLVLSEFCNKE